MSASVGICCICLKTYSILEGIYDTDENKIRHYEKLKLCVPNELWYKDYKICKNCVDTLDSSYHFIELCVQSEQNRKEAYGKNKGPFLCSECNKPYKWESILKKHINQIHKEIRCDQNKVEDIKEDNIEESFIESQTTLAVNSKPELDDLGEITIKSDTEKPSEEQTEELKEEMQHVSIPELVKDDDFEDSFDNDNDYFKEESNSSNEDCKPKKTKKRTSNTAVKKGLHKCDYCEELFQYIRQLKAHIWTTHNSIRPYSCDLCSATYKSSGSLIIHKRVHTGERPYICTECGKGFRAGADLIRHTKTHSAKRGYQCPYCDKSFKTSGNLYMHKNCVHKSTEDYKFQCNQCGHKFPFKGHLDSHLKRHAGIKNFTCHICGSKFILHTELDVHVRRVHRNEQRSKCEKCDKEFKTLCGLRKHMKLSHNLGDYKFKMPENKFLCPYCPKMFPYNNKLQRHILTHTGEKPFVCEICGKGFRDKFDLKSHLANNHHISLEPTDATSVV